MTKFQEHLGSQSKLNDAVETDAAGEDDLSLTSSTTPPNGSQQDEASPPASFIQSVGRALSVLELFSDRRPALTIAEIAALTGLNRATSYRFAHTLRQLGYLEEIGGGKFRPGNKAIALGQSALRSLELPELALPHLQKLRDVTHETVNLGVLKGTEMIFMARILGDSLLNFRFYVGMRIPAYLSTMGRAMLAFLDPVEAEAVLMRTERTAQTDRTKTSVEDLLSEFAHIREQGYAVVDEELAMGLRGIAAPILNRDGYPIAAVNVSISRPLDENSLKTFLVPALMETVGEITKLAQSLDLGS